MFNAYTVSQLQSYDSTVAQLRQQLKLLRHRVVAVGRYVVIVMLRECLVVWSVWKGPEAVDVHLVAEGEGECHHEEAGGETPSADTPGRPEGTDTSQELRVGEQDCLIG